MKHATPILLTAAALALTACAGVPPLSTPADYPKLAVKADEADTLLYVKPGVDLRKYAKVHVAPVAVALRGDGAAGAVTDEEARQLAAYAEQALKAQLSQTMALAPAPAADVLSLRLRIIGLEPTSGAQVAMMVPPFALLNMVSAKGPFMGSITLGGELYEGLAAAPSVAFVGTRSRPGIDAAAAFGRWSAVEKVLDKAAERLADDLGGGRPAG